MGKRARSIDDDECASPPLRRRCARSASPVLRHSLPSPPYDFYHPRSEQDTSLAPFEAAPSASLPLTRDNLSALERHSMPGRRTPSPTKSPKKKNKAYVEERMLHRTYGIYWESERNLPPQISSYVENILKAPRTSCSPNAKKIAKSQQTAKGRSEQDAIDRLVQLLLFLPDEGTSGVPMLALHAKINLHRSYLPGVLKSLSALPVKHESLTQAQPDHALGYTTIIEADDANAKQVFSMAEELTFNGWSPSTAQHFTFCTTQWKSVAKYQTHFQALPQGARDGATVVNYMHDFYTRAGTDFSIADTSHVSLTCDMLTVYVNIHWREETEAGIEFFMESIDSAFLKKPEDMSRIRTLLWNLLEHAMGARLSKIKTAIQRLRDNPAAIPPPLPTPAATGTTSVTNSGFLFAPPGDAAYSLKRPRMDDP